MATIRPQKVLDIDKAKDLKFPMLASTKVDGVYCVALMEEGKGVTIYSRTGKEYTSLEHLKQPLKNLMYATQTQAIIFEVADTGLKFDEISGMVRNTKVQATKLWAFVHDALTSEEFFLGVGRTFKERFEVLGQYHSQILRESPQVLVLAEFIMSDLEEAKAKAASTIKDGGEGIVLRDPDARYQPNKRNSTMVKIKRGLSYDLEVLSLEEGKGKYKGMVGKLVCKWKDGKVIKVGSGLTDEERRRWWSNFFYDEIVGKIVQIDAMSESSKGSLRQPIYKGIRFDKKEADV